MTRYVRAWAHGGPFWAVEEAPGTLMVLTAAPWDGGVPTGELRRGRLLAPVAPSKIVGIGSNYRDHAAEMGKPVPTVPKIFLKAPSAIVGPGEAIRVPPLTQRVDHEAELGVVIGRRATRVRVEDALSHVFGYTVVNDVTARDFQKEDGVFARAKGFDTFCPVGPAVVTGLDPARLAVRCTVDGAVRQDGTTADMVFDVAALVAFVSSVMTLEPGDLIATGTPAGVGPLLAGQTVTVSVEGIGALSNPVVDRDDR
jgi:2-keto-4-pentenoate hydratase/2-oxohepta-3-ene-1,7-dioic acid hydratase in catechol pathway